ncbi:PTS sugar transporter subunit IIC [Bombilactobacillus folatiphilus]|uniref:PTS sugar transporter subunit IIC n=1 Tax=Bombilactobacillus folatiphilus TaxID=2923362 RepID=UPI0037BF096C
MGQIIKKVAWDTLNGVSVGVVVALIPAVLMNLVIKALMPLWPDVGNTITFLTNIATALLPVACAVCVGMTAKLTSIQTASITLAAMGAAGNITVKNQQLVLKGSGDVINVALTIMIAYLLVLVLGKKLKAYTILLVPLLVTLVAGGIGLFLLPYVGQITTEIGIGVEHLMTLQPIVMGAVIGIVFALLIVSPISSVGIATAIGIHGVAAGSANLGITAAAFALAIYGWRVNSIGTSLAHFLGSPKMQMPNLVAHPKILLPVIVNSGLMGGLGAILKIQGTTTSAGFGFSGLVGPSVVLEQLSVTPLNCLLVIFLYIILPVGLGLLSNWLCQKRLFEAQDLALHFD